MLHLRFQENILPMEVVQTLSTASLLWQSHKNFAKKPKNKQNNNNHHNTHEKKTNEQTHTHKTLNHLTLLTVQRSRGEDQKSPGSCGPQRSSMNSFPSHGYRNNRISSIMDNFRARVRIYTLLHRQGSLLEPTNGNVHMKHIYTHIIFVGCLSYLVFSKVSLISS